MDQGLQTQLSGLKDTVWALARESLDQGESDVSRSLFEMAERLTEIARNGASRTGQNENGHTSGNAPSTHSIFVVFGNQKYDAELDLNRVNGRRGQCVLFRSKWHSTSAAGKFITDYPVNGWRFWKYYRSDGTVGVIEELRK